MRKILSWKKWFLLALVALSVQSCLGIGDNNNFNQTNTGNHNVGVNNQSAFAGKMYFTIDHNLWVLDGKTGKLTRLTQGMEVHDPDVSPNGKWVAFTVRFKNYSNIEYMATSGGAVHMLQDGNGRYYFVPGLETPKDTFKWNTQPRWAPDSKHLLFLSDFEKEDWYSYTRYDAPLLDLQVFSMSMTQPNDLKAVKDVAYAYLGDGGNRDASYRPHHDDQIIYTHYAYDDKTHTQQVIQLFMEDPNAISNSTPGTYWPGLPGKDPAIAITPPNVECIQPAFSPDGNTIAYIRRDGNQMSLDIMPTPENVTKDPNNPDVEKKALLPYKQSKVLVRGQYVSQPVWSPDGKAIAYISYTNQEFDLWLAKLSYNQRTGAYSVAQTVQLTNGGIDGDSRPAWTAQVI